MEPVTPEQEITVKGNIIGEVLLGSDVVLYHGSAKPFIYAPNGVFDPNDTGSEGAHDYGEGLYLSTDPEEAARYSLVRNPKLSSPLIYQFQADHARILDVRSRTNPHANGALPETFVGNWKAFLEAYIQDDRNFGEVPPLIVKMWKNGIKNDFLSPVTTALEQHRPVFIRETGGKGIFSTTKASGPVSTIFRMFMISQGYDGMMYRETSEGKEGKLHTSVVIMNPEKIDTSEGWEKRKVA